jgi:predicted exporter
VIVDWFPVVFVTFKVLVLATGMYYAIKWHYDQGERASKGEVLRTSSKVAAVVVLTLLAVGLFAFAVSRMVGLDLSSP